MVSALVSLASGLGSSPGRGRSIVLLGKTFHSHSASLHSDVYLGTGELDAEVKACDGLASHSGASRNTPGRFML